MKKAKVYVNDVYAGEIQELEQGKSYRFIYREDYTGSSVSLNMPCSQLIYTYDKFPPFFEGLLPEGMMLESLLRQTKLDRNDLLGQLIVVGGDLVGNITVEAF